MKRVAFLALILMLSACSTYVSPRYSISADNNVVLDAVTADHINVDSFTEPENFDNSCRAAGPISPPDGMNFARYIQKALTDELKIADKFDDKTPVVTLSGVIEELVFSSTRSLTRGSWDIGLTVNSSNGKSIFVTEYYEFHSGFIADTACKQTAEAFFPAVQNLIGTLLRSPEFVALVSP